ncbi:ABC transporter permease subunit [Thermosipho atlanticus]|uniref:ABC-2 type transport system permease protein n=1 Tax=Thermosipho atlanticus DSM 15807 TaxID=1123380 RepID=A0A1M5TRN9_9BACT|nr:ABC transporter permease subunit [Thermosipho atlanticus]SHH53266.1 ABC-2 type transport system permease protein [Thermosipho atlanticus DSM 15807]
MLFQKELKSNIKIFLIWTFVLFFFAALIAPFINGVMEDADSLKDFINSLPKFMLNLLNISENFITPEGFFSAKVMFMAEIFAGIFAIILAVNVFTSEYETKTIEYLLVKPLTRNKIFFKKFLVLFVYYTIFASVFCLSVLWLFKIYVHYEYNSSILAGFALYLYVIEIFFGALTVLFSVLFQKSFITISLSSGIFLIMFIADIFGNAMKKLEWIRYFTLFKYISLGDTIQYEKVYILNSLFFILIGLAVFLLASKIFKNEDIII